MAAHRGVVFPLLLGGLVACQSLTLDILPDASPSRDAGGHDATRPHVEAGITDGPHGGPDVRSADASRDAGHPGADASRDANPVTFCTGTQTSFGAPVHGDTDVSFTSGVATRNASELIIFDGAAAGDAGDMSQIYAQAFDLATGSKVASAAPLVATPGRGLVVHDVATAPGGEIALVYGYGGFPEYGTYSPAASPVANEGMLTALFLAPGSGAAGLTVVATVPVDAGHRDYGQAHVIWDPGSQTFVVSWEYMIGTLGGADQYAMALSSYDVRGGVQLGVMVVATENGNNYVSYGPVEQASVAVTREVMGVSYVGVTDTGLPDLSLLQGDRATARVSLASSTPYPGWITAAGTPAGIVSAWNGISNTFVGAFVPVSADGGAGTVTPIVFTGAGASNGGRSVGDNGPGAVGLAVLSTGGLSFAYVPPGLTPPFGPTAEIAYSYTPGDEFNIASWGGGFVIGLFRTAAHGVTALASGCTVP